MTFVGPLISTDRWLQDANALVASLPEEEQAAIQAANATGEYDTPEFQAANAVFEDRFLSRGPLDRSQFPECVASPRRFSVDLAGEILRTK